MKLGLISDTHIPSMGDEPPPQVITAFEGVDLILHAGDIYVQSCLDWLARIAPVEAAGSWFTSGSEGAPRTGSSLVVQVEGHSIGLIHKLELLPLPDETFPGSIAKYPADESIAAELEEIFGEPVDIVVFGYTHEAMVETHQDVLFVNPGSPTMVKQSVKMGTVAVMDVTPAGAEAQIIELADLGE
jgi:putative phosphoesterase